MRAVSLQVCVLLVRSRVGAVCRDARAQQPWVLSFPAGSWGLISITTDLGFCLESPEKGDSSGLLTKPQAQLRSRLLCVLATLSVHGLDGVLCSTRQDSG